MSNKTTELLKEKNLHDIIIKSIEDLCNMKMEERANSNQGFYLEAIVDALYHSEEEIEYKTLALSLGHILNLLRFRPPVDKDFNEYYENYLHKTIAELRK